MKGPRELKQYVSKHRKYLKRVRWDDLLIFKLSRCKKWFKRNNRITTEEMNDYEE